MKIIGRQNRGDLYRGTVYSLTVEGVVTYFSKLEIKGGEDRELGPFYDLDEADMELTLLLEEEINKGKRSRR